MFNFNIITLKQRPALKSQIDKLSGKAWPEFLLHGEVRNWSSLFGQFSEYQIGFCKGEDRLIAIGHTVPLGWDGTEADLPDTINLIIECALNLHDASRKPDAFSALAIMIDPAFRRQGLSGMMVKEMRRLALSQKAKYLIAPVRPTLKEEHPRVPFEEYINWKREDGEPFDPWIRVHWRLGARMAKVIPRSLTVKGTIDEWRLWTGEKFPSSGDYEIPGALVPVHIDLKKNEGIYYDPNVWMVHELY